MPPKRKGRTDASAQASSSSSSDAVSTIIPSALYLGPCSAASSSSFLGSNSITHVLSIGITPSPKVDGVTYHRLGLNDSPSCSIGPTVDSAVDIIEDALKSSKGRGRILVHCSAGVSRSPTIVVAWLMKSKGMTLREALGTVIRARPRVCPNEGFLSQLKDLEKEWTGGDGTLEDVEVLPRKEADRVALFEATVAGDDGVAWTGAYPVLETYLPLRDPTELAFLQKSGESASQVANGALENLKVAIGDTRDQKKACGPVAQR